MDAPRTHVMGVLNITDDSFSDGGQWLPTDLTRPDIAVTHARDMICDGATIIDIGGESTRPGAVRVTEQTELQRVIPVVEPSRTTTSCSPSTPCAPPSPDKPSKQGRRSSTTYLGDWPTRT